MVAAHDESIDRAQSEPKASGRTAIIVLGMHRSGTSALTRVISLMGAALPKDLLKAAPDNPTGYWESSSISWSNEQLLKSMGRSWNSLEPMPLGFENTATARNASAQLLRKLEADFADASLFVLKDPRICRLMPLWRRMLSDLGVDIRVVLPVRHPLEVAASLRKRNALCKHSSLLLWLYHLVEAERASRAFTRCMVFYEDLLADPVSLAQRIAADLGLASPNELPDRSEALSSFVTCDQRHHVYTIDDLVGSDDVPSWIRELYLAARRSGLDGLSKAVDGLLPDIERAQELFSPIVGSQQLKLKRGDEALAAAEAKLQNLEQTNRHLQAQREVIEQEHAMLQRKVESLTEQLQKQQAANLRCFDDWAARYDKLFARLEGRVETRYDAEGASDKSCRNEW